MATTKTTTTETKQEPFNLEAYYNEKIKIRLPRMRENAEDCFVGVNGNTFLIKRGIEVEVPRYVADAIEESEIAQELSDNYMSQVAK